MKIAFYLVVPLFILACDKEDIRIKHGVAQPSYTLDEWELVNIEFYEGDSNRVNIMMDHPSQPDHLTHEIYLKFIPKLEDTIKLYYSIGGFFEDKTKPAAFIYVYDDDVLGEHYVIDSLSNDNYIVIDCISKNKISGSFNIHFRISPGDGNYPKLATYIPDTFSLAEGRFIAKRY